MMMDSLAISLAYTFLRNIAYEHVIVDDSKLTEAARMRTVWNIQLLWHSVVRVEIV